MLETGVITESSSNWASASVLVRKKDGSVRYCVDYWSLNKKTVKDLFPLPSISQCLDQLPGNMCFSTLDMTSGYWQIEVDPKEKQRDFIKWVTRKELRIKPTLNPPNTIGAITHWKLLGILISPMGGRECVMVLFRSAFIHGEKNAGERQFCCISGCQGTYRG